MARPAKSVNVSVKNFTKEEMEARKRNEEKLKGGGRLRTPDYLSEDQKKIFRGIVDNLKAADILSKLDVPILAQTSICIDRLQKIEQRINEDQRDYVGSWVGDEIITVDCDRPLGRMECR